MSPLVAIGTFRDGAARERLWRPAVSGDEDVRSAGRISALVFWMRTFVSKRAAQRRERATVLAR
jgi:hypothetical protein